MRLRWLVAVGALHNNRLHWQRSKSLAEPFLYLLSTICWLLHVSLSPNIQAFKWNLVWQVGISHALPQPGFLTPAKPDFNEFFVAHLDWCCIKLLCKSMPPLQGQIDMSLWEWEFKPTLNSLVTVDWSKHLSLCYDFAIFAPAQSDTVFPPSVHSDFVYDLPICSLKNWQAYENYISLTMFTFSCTNQPGFLTPAKPDFNKSFVAHLDWCCLQLHTSKLLQGQFHMSLWEWEFKTTLISLITVDWSQHFSLCYDSAIFAPTAQSDTVFPPSVPLYYLLICSLKNWQAYENHSPMTLVAFECAPPALSMLQSMPASFGYHPSVFAELRLQLWHYLLSCKIHWPSHQLFDYVAEDHLPAFMIMLQPMTTESITKLLELRVYDHHHSLPRNPVCFVQSQTGADLYITA